jgi:hypothetical protein
LWNLGTMLRETLRVKEGVPFSTNWAEAEKRSDWKSSNNSFKQIFREFFPNFLLHNLSWTGSSQWFSSIPLLARFLGGWRLARFQHLETSRFSSRHHKTTVIICWAIIKIEEAPSVNELRNSYSVNIVPSATNAHAQNNSA